MDFEDILNAWEKKQTGTPALRPEDMEDMISRYPPEEPKEADRSGDGEDTAVANGGHANTHGTNTGRQEPQAELDLHGLNSREAEQALEEFINRARRRGFMRVLIVHGKGHHSQGEPVLLGVVRRYLEKCPYTGAFGPADRRHGGRGATWVNVREA